MAQIIPPIPRPPYGMLSAGNLDPAKRPVVHNPDGSISTVRTISIGTDQGEVLIPTVSPDGRILSDDEAIQLYQQAGGNFGTFRTPDAATMFARRLHNGQADMYGDQSQAPDLARIKRNVAKMVSMQAPESDIDAYIQSEGVTVDDVRNFKAQPAPTAPVQPPAAAAQPLAGASPGDFLSQGLSGLNEGIAMGLGAPVDLATAALNLGIGGANLLTGSDFKQIENPVGGSGTFRQLLSPTIGAESNDPALQATRRVGQEVGAWAVPGGGVAARSAKPLGTIARELPAVLGSGTGAAVAQQVAPGNPWAEMAGQVVGGLTPGGVSRAATRAPKAPSVDELRTATNAAYDETRNLGVAYSPAAFDNMLAKVAQEATKDGISPTRHQAAYSFITDMIQGRGKALSLTELDQLRQRVRRDLITPSYGSADKAADAHFGQIVLDQIDEMIGNAKPSDLIAGDAKEATNAILKARSLNSRLRKSEMIQDALEKARLSAAASGSGGNINNAIRQQIKSILTNPKKVRSFTAEERAMMDKIVTGNGLENIARLIGKLSPSGNGLMAALGIGGTAMNPLLAAAPVAGLAAKLFADTATVGKVRQLHGRVAGAPRLPKPPISLPPSLVYSQTANQLQNQPLDITVPYGAR